MRYVSNGSGEVRGAEDVIGDDVFQQVEPEKRKLSEDTALIRNGCGKNDVKRGKAVGGDDEQLIAYIVDIADLPACRRSETGEMRFLNNASQRSCRHGKVSPQRWGAF